MTFLVKPMTTPDLIIPFIVLALITVIVFQAVERYFFAEQYKKMQDKLLEELSRATKAVIAKNANDYVMTTSIDKVATEDKPTVDPDLVGEEELNDEEFMKSIGKQVK